MKKPEFEPNTKVACYASHDSQKHPAEVVRVRQDGTGAFVYYVHYFDCDKRLDEWVPAERLSVEEDGIEKPEANGATEPVADQKMTRRLKRKYDEIHHVTHTDEMGPNEQHLEKEYQEKTKVKNIQVIELGKFVVDTWYYSPYPEPYASEDKLYLCEFTLKYFRKKKTLLKHQAVLQHRHPPGNEIYRSPPPPPTNPSYEGGAVTNPPVCVYEVDGKNHKLYCQCLCLLSKLFLDHKTLYYDVDPFLFYVLCEKHDDGSHIVGYFSKEKNSREDFNLACILTLPPYQRKGYGRFLISFAYELSKMEGKIGTPERPLSDLGQVSFRSYWTRIVLEVLKENKGNVTIGEISRTTGIKQDDVVHVLTGLNLLKYWKGMHMVSVVPKLIDEHLKVFKTQRNIQIDQTRLQYKPINGPPPKKTRN
ncbi:hypothetical protein BSKO_06550 [Bryopsis sp. KO-2023]|nr:hypothetical protein BSKO_06550 [Bryopsis sp. KO-2023]